MKLFYTITLVVSLMILSFAAGQIRELHNQNSTWAVFCNCLERKSPNIGLQDKDFVRCNNEAVEFEKSHQ